VSRGLESGRVGGAGCAARLIVAGRVQGVGFRWFTQRTAEGLRLSGWVRNRPDGSVEAELVGESQAVQACIERLRRGPPGASVSRLEVEWGQPPASAGLPGAGGRFEIRDTG
jgi:acylphosphatase